VFQAQPLFGQGLPDRVNVATKEDTADFSSGSIEQTGRSLGVVVKGSGWIAVQAKDGTAALTRNGALSVSASGMLQTNDGHPVLGEGAAPISLPPMQNLTIGEDGTVSGTPVGQNPDQITALNRILLTDPPPTSVRRRSDGLFQDTTGTSTPSAKVRLQIGALEGSNADPVTMMMTMIENTRMFQMQTQMIHWALNAGQGQSSILTLT
jgi:flagellar basal-body rod protein FlgF